MLHTAPWLPHTPDEITPAWLGEALSADRPGVVVEDVVTREVIRGTGTKVLLTAAYASAPDDLPADLCVKANMDPRLEGLGSHLRYAREATFFGRIRRLCPVRTPRSFYAAVTADDRQGLVVLEDLGSAGARCAAFGDALTVDQVADGLLEQARWHAATWDARPGSLPRTAVGGTARQAAELFYTDAYWNAHFARPGAPEVPAELRDPGRLLAANRAQWRADDSGTLCLVHGDPHVGNTYLDRDGRLGYLDWQGYSLGRWSHDVAYFLCGALPVQARRAHERDLLALYLEALRARGGPALTPGEAWPDYVRHLLHGFLAVMTPEVMQPVERTARMAARYTTAMCDHDTLSRFGV